MLTGRQDFPVRDVAPTGTFRRTIDAPASLLHNYPSICLPENTLTSVRCGAHKVVPPTARPEPVGSTGCSHVDPEPARQSSPLTLGLPLALTHSLTHSLTDLTSLATFRLSASPIQEITFHSASSSPSVLSTNQVGNAMGTTRLSGGRMFSSTRRLRTRLSISALISCSSGHHQQLGGEFIIDPEADADGMVANDDRRRPRISDPTIVSGTYLGARGSTMRLQWLSTQRDTEARGCPYFHHVFCGQSPCIEGRVS